MASAILSISLTNWPRSRTRRGTPRMSRWFTTSVVHASHPTRRMPIQAPETVFGKPLPLLLPLRPRLTAERGRVRWVRAVRCVPEE
jgi:hypothetical protein